MKIFEQSTNNLNWNILLSKKEIVKPFINLYWLKWDLIEKRLLWKKIETSINRTVNICP